MSQSFAFTLHAEFRLSDNKASDNGDKSIVGVAYSGEPVTQWGEQYVVDLESLETTEPLALLFQHEHRSPVGVIDAIGNDGKTLTIDKGRIFSGIETDPLPRQIVDRASRGFPYQLSVGVHDAYTEIVPSGKTVTVNGREFSGPLTIIRNGRLREVSVVALGADANTEADFAASAQSLSHQQEEGDMPDPKNTGDAGDQSAVVELTARITELQAELEAEKQRADAAEQALADYKREARLAATKDLLAVIGIEYSDEAAQPYLELSDEAFDAMAQQIKGRLKANAGQPGGAMFADVSGDQSNDQAGDGGKTVSLSIDEIYAKRRAG